jgi:hypothetical protein
MDAQHNRNSARAKPALVRALRYAALAFAILTAALPGTIFGQTAAQTPAPAAAERQIPKIVEAKIGAACMAAYSQRIGVFKNDACGNLYCGEPNLKSILDVRPNYAAEKKCKWQMVGWRCQCVGGTSLVKKPVEKDETK